MHVYDWLSDMGIDRPPSEDDVVEVSFKGGFGACEATITVGEEVVATVRLKYAFVEQS